MTPRDYVISGSPYGDMAVTSRGALILFAVIGAWLVLSGCRTARDQPDPERTMIPASNWACFDLNGRLECYGSDCGCITGKAACRADTTTTTAVYLTTTTSTTTPSTTVPPPDPIDPLEEYRREKQNRYISRLRVSDAIVIRWLATYCTIDNLVSPPTMTCPSLAGVEKK